MTMQLKKKERKVGRHYTIDAWIDRAIREVAEKEERSDSAIVNEVLERSFRRHGFSSSSKDK